MLVPFPADKIGSINFGLAKTAVIPTCPFVPCEPRYVFHVVVLKSFDGDVILTTIPSIITLYGWVCVLSQSFMAAFKGSPSSLNQPSSSLDNCGSHKGEPVSNPVALNRQLGVVPPPPPCPHPPCAEAPETLNNINDTNPTRKRHPYFINPIYLSFKRNKILQVFMVIKLYKTSTHGLLARLSTNYDKAQSEKLPCNLEIIFHIKNFFPLFDEFCHTK